jgi:hypothetical protein
MKLEDGTIMMQQMQRIRYITRHYALLQGLVLTIVGLFLFVMNGAITLIWDYWLYHVFYPYSDNGLIILAVLALHLILPVILMVKFSRVALQYYANTYGQVMSSSQDRKRLNYSILFAFCVYFFLGMTIDVRLEPPVSAMGLAVALILLIHWWVMERKTLHYLLLALVATALSILPLFVPAFNHLLHLHGSEWYSNIVAVCAGCLLICAGLLDHWYLTRYMASLKQTLTQASREETISYEQSI